MPIIVSDTPPKRGPRDARRHREKQREVIKGNLPHILVDEDIITGDPKGKKVKVRIRKLEPASIRHGVRNKKKGEGGGQVGVGQGGAAKKGDTYEDKTRKKSGGSAGSGGEGPGTDEIDTEMPLEEIIELMAEEVGLPNFWRKESQHEYASEEHIRGTKRSGPRALLKRRQTVFEAMRRNMAQVEILKEETGESEEDCRAALFDAHGDISVAEKLLADPEYIPNAGDEGGLTFEINDQRFHDFEEKKIPITQAVVIVARDASWSMDEEKTYIARSTAFWIVRFLEKGYERVIVRFIIHPGVKEEAELVSEYEAFHRMSAGGTLSFSAFEKACDLVDHEYPTEHYNVYMLYFSDGDDFVPDKTTEYVRLLVEKGVSMVGYGEVRPSSERIGGESRLLPVLAKRLPLRGSTERGMKVLVGERQFPVVCCAMRERKHIRAAVDVILNQSRWEEEQ